MQPLTAPPRDTLTAAQVTGLIRDTSALRVSAGLEVVDMALNVLENITDDLHGGTVTHSAYATLHNTSALRVSRTLDWGVALVRPYTVLSDGTVSARFNLGVYVPAVPRITYDADPQTHDVQGYDILHFLNDPVGEAYAVDAGASYLTAVEEIITALGFTRYVIDPSASATTVPIARVWPLDERTTWLTVVNDLLGAVGYQGIWSDWDGRLRCQPYDPPRERAPEWYYDADTTTSMLSRSRTVEQDWFSVPNRWVAVLSNAGDESTPVDGNGIYSYQNDNIGPTSIDARGGRVVTRFLQLEAADHAALVAKAQASIDADMRLPTTVELSTGLNPLHWHFDRLYIDDPRLGAAMDVVGTEWTYTLNGSADQTQKFTVL